jgi:hypothetical protein
MNSDTKKRKSFLKDENAVIGGIIYMVVIIALSIILGSVMMPTVDYLVFTMGDALEPAAPSVHYQNTARNADSIIKLHYKVYVIFAIGGVLYAVLTPLKRMVYDKYRELMGEEDQYRYGNGGF